MVWLLRAVVGSALRLWGAWLIARTAVRRFEGRVGERVAGLDWRVVLLTVALWWLAAGVTFAWRKEGEARKVSWGAGALAMLGAGPVGWWLALRRGR